MRLRRTPPNGHRDLPRLRLRLPLPKPSHQNHELGLQQAHANAIPSPHNSRKISYNTTEITSERSSVLEVNFLISNIDNSELSVDGDEIIITGQL